MSLKLFKSLLFRASLLQRKIEDEYKRPRPDSLKLLKLKKIRLAIKDRLQRLTKHNPYGHSINFMDLKPQPVGLRRSQRHDAH
jgi:hypothetical protein